MQTIHVPLEQNAYDIHIGTGLLSSVEQMLAVMPQRRAVIVSNEVVAPLYLARLQMALEAAGVQVQTVVLPDGEQHKTMSSIEHILDAMLQTRCERKTTLIALGGGVIGDMTGFAAAIYQRGAPFIQIPTTLLAQVDSSVGGKTGINHPLGKNMIGAFYQPRVVIADLDVLNTLPDREYSAGLAEIIKYGLIDDPEFFLWLNDHMDALVARKQDALAYAIARSCANKARIVAADEREQGDRALLNLGHTFGHAIEAGLGYGVWLHGEAVAAGMVLAARCAAELGIFAAQRVTDLIRLLQVARLPVDAPALGRDAWMNWMASDKKVEGGAIRFILPTDAGKSIIRTVEQSVLDRILP
ncbi:3-dehydroquinate synthase [Burkholderiaceae bacterium DAT-1]|nr:3-dehydroquinate synthase [Burkholderiaceae bacterium DAT-1]